MPRLMSLVVVLALSPLILAGCSGGDDPLDGTEWRLSGWTLSSSSAADFTITAGFVDGRIAGRSGVNSDSGSYTVGPGNAFATGELASTEMAGPEPAMRAESVYVRLLEQAGSYELDGERLTLFDGAGNQSLVFDGVRP